MKIGADIYVNTSSPDELKAVENTLDYLIITINAAVDWNPYLASMRPNGAIAFVGAIPKPIEIPVFGILMKNVCNQSAFYIPINLSSEDDLIYIMLFYYHLAHYCWK